MTDSRSRTMARKHRHRIGKRHEPIVDGGDERVHITTRKIRPSDALAEQRITHEGPPCIVIDEADAPFRMSGRMQDAQMTSCNVDRITLIDEVVGRDRSDDEGQRPDGMGHGIRQAMDIRRVDDDACSRGFDENRNVGGMIPVRVGEQDVRDTAGPPPCFVEEDPRGSVGNVDDDRRRRGGIDDHVAHRGYGTCFDGEKFCHGHEDTAKLSGNENACIHLVARGYICHDHQTMASRMVATYIPLMVMILIGVIFGISNIFLSENLGPRRSTRQKLSTYESGMEPVKSARERFSVKFYLVAMMFILFDIEIVFMYPWAVQFKKLGMYGFSAMILFMVLLFSGYLYVIRKGALRWD